MYEIRRSIDARGSEVYSNHYRLVSGIVSRPRTTPLWTPITNDNDPGQDAGELIREVIRLAARSRTLLTLR